MNGNGIDEIINRTNVNGMNKSNRNHNKIEK